MPIWQRPGFVATTGYLRAQYERAVEKMDHVVVNSNNVRRRVQQYLGRDSVVVNPPCDVDRFYWRKPEGYYLSTARLDPLKRVDLIVRAFRKMPDKKLVVVSAGSDRDRLEALAAGSGNIVFAGEVDDARLRDLIARSIATIYVPRDEDFGMSPVESMAAGKAVIGVAEGGLLETVVDGQTGILLPPDPDPQHLVEAVSIMTPRYARDMREACEERAKAFRTELFLEKMSNVVNA
ncbi:MAG: glycosyltransferase [Gammaproteobacteria bacterium]|nr:glycosyltransferase [Gammaproteobacteria bacterium]